MRPDPGAVGESQEEIIPPFLIWDKQEQALEAWARAEECWLDDAVSAVEKRFGEEISHGAEAKVFHYDDTHVVKVISSLFDQQKTLDRITLTNFIFPFTGLQLLGLGRNADGEFCFIVKQRFVIGEHIDSGLVTIDSLDDFKCLDESIPNPEYATDNILLGDLHDRNVLITPEGRPAVIDCNLFLNTPDLGRGADKALVMLSADPSIGEADRRDLAAGLTVERNGRRIRFSLEKGCTVFLPSQEKRGQSRRAASDRIHRPSKPHGPSL